MVADFDDTPQTVGGHDLSRPSPSGETGLGGEPLERAKGGPAAVLPPAHAAWSTGLATAAPPVDRLHPHDQRPAHSVARTRDTLAQPIRSAAQCLATADVRCFRTRSRARCDTRSRKSVFISLHAACRVDVARTGAPLPWSARQALVRSVNQRTPMLRRRD